MTIVIPTQTADAATYVKDRVTVIALDCGFTITITIYRRC